MHSSNGAKMSCDTSGHGSAVVQIGCKFVIRLLEKQAIHGRGCQEFSWIGGQHQVLKLSAFPPLHTRVQGSDECKLAATQRLTPIIFDASAGLSPRSSRNLKLNFCATPRSSAILSTCINNEASVNARWITICATNQYSSPVHCSEAA